MTGRRTGGNAYDDLAEDLAEVLAHGEVDEYSRDVIAFAYRVLSEWSALRTQQPTGAPLEN